VTNTFRQRYTVTETLLSLSVKNN